MIFAECLAVFGPDKRLDFARFTRLLKELENLRRDLASNWASRLLSGGNAASIAG
jgi:hypothetical protein